MTATLDSGTSTPSTPSDDIVLLHRGTIDKILVAIGLVAAIVLAAAGGLLTWGATFSDDYVHDELASQNVFFPDKAALIEEGRDDLTKYAGTQVTTGSQAEAYAGYIGGHLEGIADGKTYSEIDDRGAAAAVTAAKEAGEDDAAVAKLQATADQLKGQRDTLFQG